jgi:hypothetical protein
MRTPVVVMDTGPLGLVTHPKGGAEARECKERFAPAMHWRDVRDWYRQREEGGE